LLTTLDFALILGTVLGIISRLLAILDLALLSI
jgi:hypothetical protein